MTSKQPGTQGQTLLSDPIFYVMLVVFVLISTALPALLGQARLLPLMQAVALTAFVAVAARHRSVKHAIDIMTIWLAIQFVLLLVLALVVNARVEQAIGNGFLFRAEMAEWAFADGVLPASWLDQPINRLIELFGITVGSALSGGLIGIWSVVRTVDLAAFSAAGFLLTPGTLAGLLVGLAPWTVLHIAGAVTLIAVLAQMLWTNTWSPRIYLTDYRRPLAVGVLLLLAAVLAEFALSPLWRAFFN